MIIQIVTKTLAQYNICNHRKMPELCKSLIKIKFLEQSHLTLQRHTILILIAPSNTSTNREIYYVIRMIYLAIYLSNVIQIHHYLELNLLIWEIFISAWYPTANSIFLFQIKLTMVKGLLEINSGLTIIPPLRIQI